jgi:hypothetical protein
VIVGEGQKLFARLPVSAVRKEAHIWVVEKDGPYSRSERARGSATYESIFPLPIVNYSLGLPMELAADLEDATKALVMPKSHSV